MFKKTLLTLALLLVSFGAFASQNATTLPTASPYPGATMLLNINSAFDTLQTNFRSNRHNRYNLHAERWWCDTNLYVSGVSMKRGCFD
jgi:hypothetical protein